jgi:hypothetical protein
MSRQKAHALRMANRVPISLVKAMWFNTKGIICGIKSVPLTLWEDGIKDTFVVVVELIKHSVGLVCSILLLVLFPVGIPLTAWMVYRSWMKLSETEFAQQMRWIEQNQNPVV